MPCLKHYFNPDFNHFQMVPVEKEHGRVDHYNMGYVQNVVKGQVIAQWIEDEEGECEINTRYFPEKIFPIGFNCKENPDNPNQLIATATGYVFYNPEGLISVKSLLNVRGDVDFSTGNIFFVGDMIVHESIKSGFDIKARNINVKGHIEASRIKAGGFLKCNSGIKGGGSAFVDAGGDIKTSFCEKATLVSGGNIIIDSNCLHTRIYSEGKLAVRGRFVGGPCYCYEYAYIGEQLGGGLSNTTQIIVGYKPSLLLKIDNISAEIDRINRECDQCDLKRRKGPSHQLEYDGRIERSRMKIRFLTEKRRKIWESMQESERLESCRVMVAGEVKVGVEISIGQAFYRVDEPMRDVCFYYKDNEIIVGSGALRK